MTEKQEPDWKRLWIYAHYGQKPEGQEHKDVGGIMDKDYQGGRPARMPGVRKNKNGNQRTWVKSWK